MPTKVFNWYVDMTIDQSKLKDVLDYCPETGWFTRKATGFIAGGVNPVLGYVQISVFGERHYGHRLAWLHVHGRWPSGNIDHINGCRSDNRISNLRECNQEQNGQNRGPQRNNSSGYKGVKWHKGAKKWAAAIKANGKHIHLGLFTDKEDAAKARKEAEIQFHEFSPIHMERTEQ